MSTSGVLGLYVDVAWILNTEKQFNIHTDITRINRVAMCFDWELFYNFMTIRMLNHLSTPSVSFIRFVALVFEKMRILNSYMLIPAPQWFLYKDNSHNIVSFHHVRLVLAMWKSYWFYDHNKYHVLTSFWCGLINCMLLHLGDLKVSKWSLLVFSAGFQLRLHSNLQGKSHLTRICCDMNVALVTQDVEAGNGHTLGY